MFVRGRVVATTVAFVMVMVMCIMAMLSVVVVVTGSDWLAIFRIVVALLIGVLGLVTMNVARLTRKLRRRFLPGLVVFLATVARQFITAIGIAIVVTITTA